ncbi:unnamed protein product [Closterium sp. Yama58-4]|nr:unnamed protein product [Closterium sp. Yama58-4]
MLEEYLTDTAELIRMLKGNLPRGGNGWKLVKVHLLLHFPDAIRRGGLPREFCTSLFEHAHTATCKRPFRASNFRQYDAAILRSVVMQNALSLLPTALAQRSIYETALMKAIAHKKQVLTTRSETMVLPCAETRAAGNALWDSFVQYHGAGMRCFPDVLRHANLPSGRVEVHTTLALPPGEDFEAHYARAALSYHGVPCFSYVAIVGHEDAALGAEIITTWYAQLMLLFHVSMLEEGRLVRKPYAFVRYYEVGERDQLTTCTLLHESQREVRFLIVEAHSILRTLHVVRSFDRRSISFINRFGSKDF